jgi:hypothetical protein
MLSSNCSANQPFPSFLRPSSVRHKNIEIRVINPTSQEWQLIHIISATWECEEGIRVWGQTRQSYQDLISKIKYEQKRAGGVAHRSMWEINSQYRKNKWTTIKKNPTVASKYSNERKSHIPLTLNQKLDKIKFGEEEYILKAKIGWKLGILYQIATLGIQRKKSWRKKKS